MIWNTLLLFSLPFWAHPTLSEPPDLVKVTIVNIILWFNSAPERPTKRIKTAQKLIGPYVQVTGESKTMLTPSVEDTSSPILTLPKAWKVAHLLMPSFNYNPIIPSKFWRIWIKRKSKMLKLEATRKTIKNPKPRKYLTKKCKMEMLPLWVTITLHIPQSSPSATAWTILAMRSMTGWIITPTIDQQIPKPNDHRIVS